MRSCSQPATALRLVAALAALVLVSGERASAASERPLFVSVGDSARAPIGWLEFCTENPRECATPRATARDVVLSAQTWNSLTRINAWVNDSIKPMTDMDHWGVVEKWS